MFSIIPSSVWGAKVAPSDQINVGLIGCRNHGFSILRHHLSNEGVNCVALCDVDENVLNSRAADVKESYNQEPRLYKDFRRMLEQQDMDAVIIGTPDHWHCLNFVYACQAGKDIYVEKPLANTIAECDIMVRAAGRYNRVVQVGQQQRSNLAFKESVDLIKENAIGKLRKVNIWANFNYGIGATPVDDGPVPEGVDYDLYPEYDGSARRHRAESRSLSGISDAHGPHVRNFLDCIKTRETPLCTVEMGYAAALHGHIPNIAGRVGETQLEWDEENKIFTNNDDANRIITPEYRAPWRLPEI